MTSKKCEIRISGSKFKTVKRSKGNIKSSSFYVLVAATGHALDSPAGSSSFGKNTIKSVLGEPLKSSSANIKNYEYYTDANFFAKYTNGNRR